MSFLNNCCDRCGIRLDDFCIVRNEYPIYGFPHDTAHLLCDKCRDKFNKYMTKKYDAFFTALRKGGQNETNSN